MRLVIQPGGRGCGQAAVATLCGRTYNEVAEYIASIRNTSRPVSLNASTSRGVLESALRHFGRPPLDKIRRLDDGDSLSDLKNDALINCFALCPQDEVKNRMDAAWKPYGHWAVWDADVQTILDPYRHKSPLYVTRVLEVVT